MNDEKFLENYRKGFPYLKLRGAAVPGDGIKVLDEAAQNKALEYFSVHSGSKLKFVPASGAASRMFKELFEARDILERGGELDKDSNAARFVDEIERYPFYTEELFDGSTPFEVIDKVIGKAGLDYGNKPKGQILFHKYETQVRTAFEEHLVEGADYAKDENNVVNLHFTVSPDHMEGFKRLLDSVYKKYEERFGVRYNVSFSVQDPSTDIIAVNEDNTPFIKDDGTPLYRPGGHGALIRNLNQVDADIIFLKNIDNVVNERLIADTLRWKKILAGELLRVRGRVFSYMMLLESGNDSPELLEEIKEFLNKEFSVVLPDDVQDLKRSLRLKLDRPIRVCGMVRNEGEPGGGPFIAFDSDGSTSLQILEAAQLDKANSEVAAMIKGSTHFNPVDLVCSVHRYTGEKYELEKYVDHNTGFISQKSYQGRNLKAQELPGLWNGAMSNWNTMFVEVPLITFNPVKSVFDLLRPEHL